MSAVTIGLKAVSFGAIAVDGGPATVFVQKFMTSTDSFTFNQDTPTEKTVDVEEQDDPLYILRTKGRKSITLNIANMDVDTLAYFEGGTVTTASGTKTYAEPDSIIPIEFTVKIEPEIGLTFIINRGLCTLADTGNLGKNNEKLYALTIDCLKPTKTGVPVRSVVETVPVVA